MKKSIYSFIVLLVLSLSPAFGQLSTVNKSVDFGCTEIATTGVQTIVVENIGSTLLNIGTPRFNSNDKDFYSSSTIGCTSLLPTQKCSIQIQFQPMIPGVFNASIRIPVETAGFDNLTVNLKGRGAGVINIGTDTVESVRVWQKQTIAFILRKIGAASYDYRLNSNEEVQRTVLNTQTGEFLYTPDSTQRRPFSITFMAKNSLGAVLDEVTMEIAPIPGVNPEEVPAGVRSLSVVPDSISRDYSVITNLADETEAKLNYANGKLRTVTISGKSLRFDSGDEASLNLSKLLRAEGDTTSKSPLDLKELILIAESILIRDSLVFKQTNVTITAKELRFVDKSGNTRACINTEPEIATNALPNTTGASGLNAGTIRLNIGKLLSFRSDGVSPRTIVRFFAKGGDGQTISTAETPTLKPGTGGNGGSLIVNRYSSDVSSLQQYFDAPGGLSGNNKDGIRTGNEGAVGQFQARPNGEYDWVRPTWVRLGMIHLRDAYLFEKWEYVRSTSNDYVEFLTDVLSSSEFSSRSITEQAELRSLLGEAQEIQTRIQQNLDYYGNPFGWAPNLSFEYSISAYENEINYAIPALAFIYQVQNRYNILKFDENRINSLLDTLNGRRKALVDKWNILSREMDDVNVEIEDIGKQTTTLQNRLIQRANDLEEQAKNNTKRRGWRRVAQIGGAICRIASIATFNPMLRQVGNGLDAVANMQFSGNLIKNGQKAYNDFQSFEKEWQANGENLKSQLPKEATDMLDNPEKADKYPAIGPVIGIPVTNSQIVTTVNENLIALANLRSSLSKLTSAIRTGAAPAHVIQAELARLKASDPEFNTLINEIERLTLRRGELIIKLEKIIANLTFIINELPRIYLSASALTTKVAGITTILDPRVSSYMKDMEKNIRDRLLLYNYYMRKSYEYRFLQPYPYTSNPLLMFESVRKLVDANGSGTIPPTLIKGMRTIFEDDLRNIASTINTGYQNGSYKKNPPPTEYIFTSAQKSDLNNNKEVVVNPYEVISDLRSEDGVNANEDVRIVDITFDYSIKTLDTNSGVTPKLRLQVDYPKKSIVMQNGIEYNFFYSDAANQNWSGVKLGNNPIVFSQIASSDVSLLRLLLGNNSNIDFFARPGVNAPLTITSNPNTRDNAIIDTTKPAKLIIKYEFRPQNVGQKTVFITTNSAEIKSKMLISQYSKDPERRDGNGSIKRSFDANSTIKIEAEENYGLWNFDKWEPTDKTTVIPNPKNPELTLSMASVRNVRAVYRGPLQKMKISLSDKRKDSLRLLGKTVLLNKKNTISGIETSYSKDSVSINSNVQFLDGRTEIATANTEFTLINNSLKEVVLEKNLLKANGPFTEETTVKVEARYVNNTIEIRDTIEIKIAADTVVGIQEEANRNVLEAEVFPNPANNDVTLSINLKRNGIVRVVLYEPTGRAIKAISEQYYQNGHQSISFSTQGISNGSYYIKIQNSDGSTTIPLTVFR